ncbi:hypothetical protein ACH4FX_00540 [Streptomyces sp. NPDC018019]|uniref:hypothetical protein n=1 Tax=Streptomyces sp. NPDC018019 TaxID=3365030 RepID=UPI0037AC5903
MRKAARITGTAVIAALLLSGCGGSSGGSGKGDAADRPGRTPAATPSQTADGGPTDGTGSLDGAWTARTGDSHLTLVIYRGTASMGLGADTGAVCQGKIERLGSTVIALKCMGGHTTRTLGTVEPGADGRTLTVRWKGGPADRFTKAEGKLKLPGTPSLPAGPPGS